MSLAPFSPLHVASHLAEPAGLQPSSLPHVTDPVGARPPTAEGGAAFVQMLQFLLGCKDPTAVLHRAVASLGVLAEVEWAELDGNEAGDLRASFVDGASTHTIQICLAQPTSVPARANVAALLQLIGQVYAHAVETVRLRAESMTDPLTGLCNRRGFEPQVDQALARAARTGEEIALMLVDLDHFKAVNDALGHAAGDAALLAVAEAIRGVIRPTDVAARIGGDEIAVLLSACDAEGALRVCERLRATVNAANPLSPRRLTLSIGVADRTTSSWTRPVEMTSAELIRAADSALYMAKAGGRDRAMVHPRQSVAACAVIEDDATQPISISA